jgi:hypothetical protein
MISSDDEELRLHKQLMTEKNPDAKFSGVVHLNDNLKYITQVSSVKFNNGMYIIPMMTYCFQRLNLIGLYDLMVSKEIVPLCINVDMIYFDYTKLDEAQQEFLNLTCNKNFGHFKLELDVKKPVLTNYTKSTMEIDLDENGSRNLDIDDDLFNQFLMEAEFDEEFEELGSIEFIF